MRQLLCVAVLGTALTLPSVPRAQAQVWVVDDQAGPGVDFQDLQAAIDTVAEGDVLLLRTGTFSRAAGFQVLGKSLTIVEDQGATALVEGGLAAAHLAAGQSVLVRGVDAATTVAPASRPLLISDVQGSVWIEGGGYRSASGAQTTAAAGVLFADAAFLVRCGFKAGAALAEQEDGEAGVALLAASVAMYGCAATGGSAGPQDHGSAGTGGPGLQIPGPGCFLAASGCQFQGGAGGLAEACGFPPGTGGAGIFIFAPPPSSLAFLHASLLHGGPGGTGGGGACFGASGPPSSAFPRAALSETPGTAKGLRANAPVREGEVLVLDLEGAPGDLAFVGASTAPSPAVALVSPTGALAIAAPWWVVSAGAVPASGALALALPVGELGPGIEAAVAYLQPCFLDTGGSLTFGAPSATVLLDAAF